GQPIDMNSVRDEMEELLADRDRLRDFLVECRSLKISPALILRAVAVYEFSSIRAAAAALQLSQPQLSKQMSELETILNTQLFIRKASGLDHLPKATVLYKSALQLSDICESLIQRGDLLFRREVTTTHLGTVAPFTTSSALCRRLCDLCETWRRRYTRAQIKISADTTDQLFARLNRNELHCAIVDTPDVPDQFESLELSRMPLRIAMKRTQKQELPALRVAQTQPFALPSRHNSLRILIDDWMQKKDIQFHSMIEVESMTLIANLVEQHGYCSFLPKEAAVGQSGYDFLELPDAPQIAHRLVWKPEMTANRHVNRIIQAISAQDPQLGAIA
ncbi:LysR family transcriptional regulator, partial [Thioclava indica]